jgi:hypothetical protein
MTNKYDRALQGSQQIFNTICDPNLPKSMRPKNARALKEGFTILWRQQGIDLSQVPHTSKRQGVAGDMQVLADICPTNVFDRLLAHIIPSDKPNASPDSVLLDLLLSTAELAASQIKPDEYARRFNLVFAASAQESDLYNSVRLGRAFQKIRRDPQLTADVERVSILPRIIADQEG